MEEATTNPRFRLNRWMKILIGLVGFILFFGLFGYFAGPPILKHVLVKNLSEQLNRPVSLGEIDISPYAMTVRMTDLKIGDPSAGELLGLDELFVDLDIASVRYAAPVVQEIRLAGPRVHLVRESADKYNISDLIDKFSQPSPEPPKPEGPPPGFSINNIKITNAKFQFDDKPVNRQHLISDVNIALPFISNLEHQANLFTEPAFSAVVNGAPLVLAGKTKPFGDVHESELQLDLKKFDITPYAAYSPKPLPFALTSGQIDSDLRLVFRQAPKEAPTLNIAGGVQLSNLRIQETNQQPLLGFSKLDVPLTGLAPLTKQFQIGSIGLDGLEIFARVDKSGNLNCLSLAEQLSGQPAKGATDGGSADKPAAPPAPEAEKQASNTPAVNWSVEGFKLNQANVHWQDDSNAKPVQAHLKGIDIAVGKLNSALAEPITADLGLAIDAAPHASLTRFEVKGAQVDLPKRHVQIANVLVNGLKAAAARQADGKIVTLQGPNLKGQAKAKPEGKATPTKVAGKKAAPASKGPSGEADWVAEVAKVELTNANLQFEDKAVKPATNQTIDISQLTVEKFSTLPKAEVLVNLAAKLNKKGNIKVSGPVQLSPINTKLKLDLKEIELLPVQPYFGDKLNVTITKGQVSTQGDLALNILDDDDVRGGYRGQFAVANFHSVDKLNSTDFLSWKSFYFGKIDLALKPFALAVGDVALTDFFARVIISPEGKLNLTQIVKKDDAAEPAPQPGKAGEKTADKPADKPAEATVAKTEAGTATAQVATAPPGPPPPPIRIDKVTLQGGNVKFTDNFVKPNYTATLSEVGGRITGLSSAANSTADIDLRAAYDGAPVTVAGTMNPLASTPALDIKTEVKGVELTPLSPYSGKYAGYAIDKGKLSLFLNYKIAEGKLQAENRVFLDQLTFGQKVDSPDAINAPVTLAVSLLQNRKGEIDINLPITGSLNDPEFSVGGVIVQVIVNVITKAITAPFALLGSLGGGGEEMSLVTYTEGRSALNPDMVKRLEGLAKALDDRPGLKLEITGRIDPDKDREGMRSASIENKVKAQLMARMVKEGKEAGTIDDISVDPKDYDKLLEEAYKQEKFPKPRNAIGMAKSLPREEMEKLMLSNAQVSDDDLRELATQRAKVVADWLAANGKIPRERIFLLPPKLVADDSGPKDAPLSRAEFSLK